MKDTINADNTIITNTEKPSREEAMAAVDTLIRWAGDNPNREGLIETPKRVVKAYEEFFKGYTMDPDDILAKTFEEEAEENVVKAESLRTGKILFI